MDGRCGVVDIGNRARRRHRLQVAVVEAVLGDVLLQLRPVLCGGGVDRGGIEKSLDLFGARLELRRIVGVEELAAGVGRVLEADEALPALHGHLVRRRQGGEQDAGEVGVGEVQALLGAVLDVLAAQVAVEVHLAQADGVGIIVALAHGRH